MSFLHTLHVNLLHFIIRRKACGILRGLFFTSNNIYTLIQCICITRKCICTTPTYYLNQDAPMNFKSFLKPFPVSLSYQCGKVF